MAEQYVPYSTTPEVPADSNVSALRDDEEGFRIILSEPRPGWESYCARFDHPLAYRVTDEGDRLRSMGSLGGKATHPICRVTDSEWLQWFLAECLEIRKDQDVIHWAIVTPNQIVDVLSSFPPSVEML